MRDWVSSRPECLPDFIIAGAMKSGTSTLHHILGGHPDVYIPKREIGFFDIDDFYQHRDFSFYSNNSWIRPSVEQNPEAKWNWYRSFFDNAPDNCILGEDSTSYLASSRTFERIASQSKSIKIFVCLRHPTDRAYSQYWHMVRTGRIQRSFEKTILKSPHQVLDRSQYRNQIKRLLDYIPRHRVFFFVLEDYLAERAAYLRATLDFIGADASKFNPDNLSLHSNRALTPRVIRLQWFKNAVLERFAAPRYAEHLGQTMLLDRPIGQRIATRLSRYFDQANLSSVARPPAMRPETRNMLDQYFSEQFSDLNEFVGFDIRERWFGSRA